MKPQTQPFLDLLEHELRVNTGFVRIHAAEVLIEHSYGFKVSPMFQAEVDSTTPGYRVGVWRVLVRSAKDEAERRQFADRIRRVMLDAAAPDRVGAAESLAKLNVASRLDRPALEQWLQGADDATAAFPLWLLVLSSDAAERARDEARLARLLESPDPIARLRASFGLGRLEKPSADSIGKLNARAAAEPADSPARVYLLGAALLHSPRGSAAAGALKEQLLGVFGHGKANEQYEAATVIGLRGTPDDFPALIRQLKSEEADARIGAAGAALHLAR